MLPDLGAIDMRFRPLLERMLQPNPADRPAFDDHVHQRFARWSDNGSFNQSSTTKRTSAESQPRTSRRGYLCCGCNCARHYGRHRILHAYDGYLAHSITRLSDLVPTPPSSGPSPPVTPPKSRRRMRHRMPRTLVTPSPLLRRSSFNPPVSRAEKIKRYLKQYSGGDCFFITPVAIGDANATLEGLAHQ